MLFFDDLDDRRECCNLVDHHQRSKKSEGTTFLSLYEGLQNSSILCIWIGSMCRDVDTVDAEQNVQVMTILPWNTRRRHSCLRARAIANRNDDDESTQASHPVETSDTVELSINTDMPRRIRYKRCFKTTTAVRMLEDW